MSGLLEWVIFLPLSAVAVVAAAGMLLTMSMYRAGLALMSSFIALAGLFILLEADLMALIQLMMNVGGMMVMILFMVMLMMDPGGEMMWDMKRNMDLRGLGAFSMSMPRGKPPADDHEPRSRTRNETYTCPMHPEVQQQQPGKCPKCGMDLVPRANQQPAQTHGGKKTTTYTCPMHPEVRQQGPGTCPKCGMELVPLEEKQEGAGRHAEMEKPENNGAMPGMSMMGMSPRQHYQMMVDMAMSTAQLPWALAIGGASAALLIILMIRTAWPLSAAGPTQDSTSMVGELLLSRYMIGFEGAAFLILAGMVGAVIFAKREAEHRAPGESQAEAFSHAQTYTCPMHPEVRLPGPGQCPKCGMDLVPAK